MPQPIFSHARFQGNLYRSVRRVDNACVDGCLAALAAWALKLPVAPLSIATVVVRRLYIIPGKHEGKAPSPTIRLIIKTAMEAIGILGITFLYRAICVVRGDRREFYKALGEVMVTNFCLRLVDGGDGER